MAPVVWSNQIYLLWRDNFGNILPGNGNRAVIPEPAALSLGVLNSLRKTQKVGRLAHVHTRGWLSMAPDTHWDPWDRCHRK